MAKIDLKGLFAKLPKAFLGLLVGLILGGMGGGLFANIGYATFIPWEEILLFLGGLFGFVLGYSDE